MWRNLFSEALPCLQNFLNEGGRVYLPNMVCLREQLLVDKNSIEPIFSVKELVDPLDNPLFRATSLPYVEEMLLECPSAHYNATETKKLNQDCFFIELQKRKLKSVSMNSGRLSIINQMMSPVATVISQPDTSLPKIHVFVGPCEPTFNQLVAFNSAFFESSLAGRVRVTYLNHKDVKNLKWSQYQIFDWLYNSKMHVILCHMHQGKKYNNNGVWDVTDYLLNLSNLDSHLGIPMGEQLSCPMFCQNKMDYICALGDMAISSLFVAMKNFYFHENQSPGLTNLIYSDKAKIFKWKNTADIISKLVELGYNDQQIFVVKFPFKTHGECMKNVKGFAGLEQVINIKLLIITYYHYYDDYKPYFI